MSKHFLNQIQRDTILHHPGGCGMPEVVEGEVLNARLPACRAEGAAEGLDRLRFQVIALESPHKDELRMIPLAREQQLSQGGRDGKHQQPSSRRPALDAEVDLAPLEVDLVPSKLEDVGQPEPGQQGAQDRVLQVLGGAVDEPLGLRRRQSPRPGLGLGHHVPADTDLWGGVAPFVPGLVDDLAERGEHAVDAAVGHPSPELGH